MRGLVVQVVSTFYPDELDAGKGAKTPFFLVIGAAKARSLNNTWVQRGHPRSYGYSSKSCGFLMLLSTPASQDRRGAVVASGLSDYQTFRPCGLYLRNCQRGASCYTRKVNCLGLDVNTYFGKFYKKYLP
jgi:hypothetical protein